MKKQFTAMLLTAVMVVSLLFLSACGGEAETSGPDGSETPAHSDIPETTDTPEPTLELPVVEDLWTYIGLTGLEAGGGVCYAEEPIILEEDGWTRGLSSFYVLSQKTQLTLSNCADAEDNCYIRADISLYRKTADGIYSMVEPNFYLTEEGSIKQVIEPDDYDNYGLKLRPGESITFTFPEDDGSFYYLSARLTYPDSGQNGLQGWYFFVDDEAAARL